MSRLPPVPDVVWDDGVLRSRTSDDIYFSRAGGLAETRTVFLQGCDLPDGWRGRRQFAIGELGFGAGLNAVATWDLWRRTRAPGAVLHFVSVEGFPLEREDAARALAPFEEVAPLSAQLLARWPVRARGPQRLWFSADGFALTVVHASAETALAGLVGAFDAWFLDGFAPARNADMWRPELLQQIAALSAPGARLASYTVAGDVRRGLAAAGFEVEKRPGFAGKRERLEARLRSGGVAPKPRPDRIAIVGAGVAGASLAQALMRRGVTPVVLDAQAPASGASGNPVGVLSPRLDRGDTGAARMFLAAYLAALDAYGDAFTPCGLLHHPRHARERAALDDLLADPPLPPHHMRAEGDGAFYPQTGIVRPAAAVAQLLDGADVRCGVRIHSARSEDGRVTQQPEGGAAIEADAVVYACGAGLAALAPSLSLQHTRGQVEWGPVSDPPTCAREAGPYMAPHSGGVIFGATFDRLDGPCVVSADEDSRTRNLAALATLDASLAARIDRAHLSSRAAVRAATPARTPLAGPLADGLHVLGALGSRGFLTAPLLAETVAGMILDEPQMLDRDALAVLAPARRRVLG